MREIFNGIFYVLRSGCAWRLLPHDWPAWSTVYDYLGKWRNDGMSDGMLTTRRERLWVYEFLAASSAAVVMLTRLAKTKQKKRTRMMKTKVA